MKPSVLLILLAMALTLPVSGQAEIYKWIDAKGVVTFKDTPPPEGIKAEVINVRSAPISSNTENGSTPNAPKVETKTAPAAAVAPRNYPRVEIYATSWCPSCKAAINYLDTQGVPYTHYDIERDSAADRRLTELYHQKSIPFTIIGKEQILGFSRKKFDAALGIGQ